MIEDIVFSLMLAIMTVIGFHFASKDCCGTALDRGGRVAGTTRSKKIYCANGIAVVSAIQAVMWFDLALDYLQTIKLFEKRDWYLFGLCMSGRLVIHLVLGLLWGVALGFSFMVINKNRCGLYFWQKHIVYTED